MLLSIFSIFNGSVVICVLDSQGAVYGSKAIDRTEDGGLPFNDTVC